MKRWAAAILAAALSTAAHAGEFGVNVYGLSYHFERERARELGLTNELNLGLGARYRETLGERLEWFFDAGAYRDSARNTAVIAGPGVLIKAGNDIGLGGAVAYFHSKTYNQGRGFIAPVPMATYELGAATLNLVYFPKVSPYNATNQIGLWLTFWPASLR